MQHIRNGMPAADLGEGWSKPWSSPNGGSCLEAKKLPGGTVALRQSADPAGPALRRVLVPRAARGHHPSPSARAAVPMPLHAAGLVVLSVVLLVVVPAVQLGEFGLALREHGAGECPGLRAGS